MRTIYASLFSLMTAQRLVLYLTNILYTTDDKYRNNFRHNMEILQYIKVDI